jgi:hypothetical protein
MTFLTENTRNLGVRRTLIAGAIGAAALGATEAPALADVLGYYYAQPGYIYTEPTTTYVAPVPAPNGTTTTTTTTYNSVVTAPTAPPAPRVEVIPPSPGSRMVWEPGHWSFNGATWDWVPGHYEAAPQPTAQWIPGPAKRIRLPSPR